LKKQFKFKLGSRTPDRQKRHLDYAFENQEKKRAKLPRSGKNSIIYFFFLWKILILTFLLFF